jgi:hypothetical protein
MAQPPAFVPDGQCEHAAEGVIFSARTCDFEYGIRLDRTSRYERSIAKTTKLTAPRSNEVVGDDAALQAIDEHGGFCEGRESCWLAEQGPN